MTDVALEYFNNDNMVIDANSSYVFYSYLSEEKNQDTPDKNANTMNPYRKLMGEFIIK